MEEKIINPAQTEQEKPQSVLRLFKVLYKNIVLIIMGMVLFGLIGYGYAYLNVRTVHTASYSMILRTVVDPTPTGSTAINNASLAKIYVEVLSPAVKSAEVIDLANEIYNVDGDKTPISGGSASVSTNENSFIFKISYSDYDANIAREKLDALILGMVEKLPEYSVAEDITLIKVQNGATFSSSNSSMRYIVLGIGAGLVFGVAIALIRFFADNTVKDREEFEEMTGVSVLSHLGKKKK